MSSIKVVGQDYALVNNGCHIYTGGYGNPNLNPTISLNGSFLNLNAGAKDGTIELNQGHILLDGDWINDANNNVFTNLSGNQTDGFVTFQNPTTLQLIDGISPTHFENIILSEFRKQLNVDNILTQGILDLDAVLVLNGNNFIINNPNPLSLNYQSGFIKSETLPGNYGTLQWNVGNGLGTFIIPFGSDNSLNDDLNLTINLKTPIGFNDNFKFATYPADIYNFPLPTGASPLELEPFKVVDRYWIIQPSDPTNAPTADITFTYTSSDIASGYNSLNSKVLKASRNNDLLGKWMDMQPRGSNAANTVRIDDVLPTEFFSSWTLVNIPGPIANVFVPDAFTPDGDGLNDVFIPVFQVDFIVSSYEFIVFDRWGNIMFQTKDPLHGWNGKKDNSTGLPKIGVYSWLIIVKGYETDIDNTYELKEKITGRVTLYM